MGTCPQRPVPPPRRQQLEQVVHWVGPVCNGSPGSGHRPLGKYLLQCTIIILFITGKQVALFKPCGMDQEWNKMPLHLPRLWSVRETCASKIKILLLYPLTYCLFNVRKNVTIIVYHGPSKFFCWNPTAFRWQNCLPWHWEVRLRGGSRG